MNTLLILYLVYLSWGTVGQGRVSILEMARYLRKSKTATRDLMVTLANEGLLEMIELISDGGQKKYFVQLSSIGDDYLMLHFDAAIDAYHHHVAETILAMKAAMNDRDFEPRKMTKKELLALQHGQKGLFD